MPDHELMKNLYFYATKDAGVDNRTEVVIRGLMVYLSENAEHLITHYQVSVCIQSCF